VITLDEVKADSARYGPIAYLGTVSASGTPYTSPVAVAWHGDELLAFVATAEAKVANVRANGKLTVHFAVSETTGWDSCVLWGDARVIDTTAERTALWGAMGYDLDRFEPGGPGADTHVFIAMRPIKAVILRTYGIDGREEWRM
jgi:nitroimidazol reductase NimA-like FMN-containing flavoprotein (pyridoxamine 5'-phosphate oxidase superfamily)